jgi:hypothetical protein
MALLPHFESEKQYRQHQQWYKPEFATPVAREINAARSLSGGAAAYLDPRQKKAD